MLTAVALAVWSPPAEWSSDAEPVLVGEAPTVLSQDAPFYCFFQLSMLNILAPRAHILHLLLHPMISISENMHGRRICDLRRYLAYTRRQHHPGLYTREPTLRLHPAYE